MIQTIFLHEDRLPFLLSEMPEDTVKVVGTQNGMITVEITINSSYDMLKFFHAGMKAGESIWTRQN
jgi:hypothetical protein